MEARVNKADWVEEGLGLLAEFGVDGVKVEPLARRLSVTKGGFYWHFKDRPELLVEMLETWRSGRIGAIRRHARDAGKSPQERIEGLVRLYIENVNPKGVAIELAIRDWARRDEQAAEAVADVDATRLELVAALFRELGLDAEAAQARAFLMYSFLFGQVLVILRSGEDDRRRLVGDCVRTLLA